MKVLLLTTEHYASIYGEFYAGMHKQLGSMDTRRLGEAERANLKNYFAQHVDLTKFDRIIVHSDFNYLKPQLRFFKFLENLVFFNTSAHFGDEKLNENGVAQLKFFKKIPWAKIIVTNFHAMKTFQNYGLDAWCVPEGFNSSKYSDKDEKRTIELAFIKNLTPTEEEKAFRKQFMREYPKTYVEPSVVQAGMSRLYQAKIAICADIERGEYGGKVFQAMASGCLVMAYNQGNDENFCLSLKDMENIVLFQNFEELNAKIAHLRQQPEELTAIAKCGYDLALNNHKASELGRQAGNYIVAGVRDSSDYGLGISAFGFRF